MKKITIYDIAKKLNISATTVSRSLNDKAGIGQKTRSLVKKTASEMQYTPNNIAFGLRKQKTKTIGIVVSRINRPFISAMISGMEEIANKENYFVFISQTIDSYKKEKEIFQSLLSQNVDGIIVSFAMETTTFDHIISANNSGIPVVLADRVSDSLIMDKVYINNFQASYNATQYLIKKGHQRIAYFSGSIKQFIYKRRKEGYLQALKDHQIPFDDSLIFEGVLTEEEGEDNMREILKMEIRPTAVFSTNDTSVMQAMLYASRKGINIPEEMAFVGFNDDPGSRFVTPPLTTLAIPAREIGKKAAEILLKKIENPNLEPTETVLDTVLVERASSDRNIPLYRLYADTDN